MRILALDTSSKAASCAIQADGVLLGESFIHVGRTHSQTILPMVEDLLRQTGLTLRDMDRFAVTNGPGSFTGLRIGISVVKGMAMALEKPCAGVSTLWSLAANLRMLDGYIVPVMDARRDQVYTAIFSSKDGILQRVEEDDALSLEELQQRLKQCDSRLIYLVGDGAVLCKERIALDNLRLAPETLRHQRASSVAWAALEQNQYGAPEELLPIYLRMSQAERERLAKES